VFGTSPVSLTTPAMPCEMMKAPWCVPVSALVLLACQRADVRPRSASIPPGWVAVSPPAANSDAERCANYARDEWGVALNQDSTSLVITPAKADRRADTVRVGPDILVGNDIGEFGGALWRETRQGTHDTIRISGRDTSAFHADNLRAFVRRGDQVFALVGVAHLSLDVGELIYLSRATGGRWEGRSVLDLRGAPMAVTRVSDDTILVLTLDSLLAVALDPTKPTRHALAGNTVWRATYASSLVRDRAGVVYMGMRSAIGRLRPVAHGYQEDWLVPTHCRVRVLSGDDKCTCNASDD
jgi:hypothetical protein